MFSFHKLNISGPHPQKGQTVVVHYTGMPIILLPTMFVMESVYLSVKGWTKSFLGGLMVSLHRARPGGGLI